MSNPPVFNVKTHLAEKSDGIFDVSDISHFQTRKHAVHGMPRMTENNEKGMSYTVTSRELVRQVPTQNRLFSRFTL